MKESQNNFDQTRWKRAIRLVYKHYWHETKRNRKFSYTGLLMPALNNILVGYIPPLAIAGIVAKATTSTGNTVGDFLPYILLFSGSWLLGEIVMRVGTDSMIRAEYRSE